MRVKSEDGTPFRIHKVLAMYYSEWFRDRLGSGSVARADDKMILGSVDNKTMVAFLEWLYKQTKVCRRNCPSPGTTMSVLNPRHEYRSVSADFLTMYSGNHLRHKNQATRALLRRSTTRGS